MNNESINSFLALLSEAPAAYTHRGTTPEVAILRAPPLHGLAAATNTQPSEISEGNSVLWLLATQTHRGITPETVRNLSHLISEDMLDFNSESDLDSESNYEYKPTHNTGLGA